MYLTQVARKPGGLTPFRIASESRHWAGGTATAGNAASSYGFTVTQDGVGASTFSIGTDGAAVGQANGTTMNLLDILLATDALSANANGNLYGGNPARRLAAFDLYSAINSAGSI